MSIQIKKTNCQFDREPLIRPLGFKGGYMKEIWQIAVLMETSHGVRGLGLGTQSVLWSDQRVFTSTSESGGNCLMLAITDYALQLVRERTFDNPIDLQTKFLMRFMLMHKRSPACLDLVKILYLMHWYSLIMQPGLYMHKKII